MSGGGAELWEFAPLERLAEGMQRAPLSFDKALSEAELELGPRLRWVERAVEAMREGLTRAERYLDEVRSSGGDDEEGDASLERQAEEQVEEARRRLEAMQRAADDVRQALSAYKVAARDMISAGSAQFPGGARFLLEQVEFARAYRAIEVPVPSEAPRAAAAAPAPATLAPPDGALPDGFFWLPLAEVAKEDRLNDPALWEKVSHEEMEGGVRRLYDELLPLLKARPGITHDELREVDRIAGRVDPRGLVHPASLANLYEIFFSGKEPVSAERYPDGRWHVQGRHRVSLAASLGHTHIPARLQGRS